MNVKTRVHGEDIGGTGTLWRVAFAMLTAIGMVVTLLFVTPPPPAHAVTDDDPSFVLTQNDLEFILRQIQVSEAHAADVLDPSNYELLCTDQGDSAQNCVSDEKRPSGVRTVDGSFNNLRLQQSGFGASDNAFPRLLEQEWRQADPEVAELGFEANTPAQVENCDPGTTCYAQTDGSVYDAHPREISNLIVDQTTNNPAIRNQVDAGTAIPVPGTDRVITPNTAPDEELSAPFNTFTGFFGQFFDHGLDLVGKGGNGTMIVPLSADDPLFCPANGERPGTAEACDPDANFITLSRAARIDDTGTEHVNLTSPFIDQNQTYSSHPAHQVFLREYVLEGGVPVATGRLIEGQNGGMAKWSDVKAQAANILGLEISDADLLDVPQVNVDLYGNFVPGENGFPQFITGSGFVSGTPGGTPVPDDVLGTGHAFLDDIAHGSTPVVDPVTGELLPRFNPDGTPVLDGEEPVLTGYDNATLDQHFIAGDGRVNENIGLTAVHSVFHAEHNRMVGQILDVLNGEHPELEAQDSAERGGIAEFAKAFRGEAHSYLSDKPEDNLPGYFPAGGDPASLPEGWGADDWHFQERLFQAAKFATEMQYQHLVFEEFGRKISPNIDAVVFNENSYNASIDPSITAEFAHVVYRFGHSMMTEEIGREAVEGGAPMQDVPLLTGFLNPTLFDENGTLTPEEAAGSLINGMTARVGSQIDEHVVDVLRNNLLGLPLDLATLNLLRGRDTGIPGLQEARRTFFAATGDTVLAPYTSWDDFGRNIKNGNNFGRAGERASLVNFVAAYGTHQTIIDAETIEQKREAAALLVNGAPLGREFVIRHAGSDRFETAALISKRLYPGNTPLPVVYITNGYNFPDGLAGAAAAAFEGGPLLLTAHSPLGEIPVSTVAELERLQPERIVVLGGGAAVTPETVTSLQTYATSGVVDVLAGADRYETAALISERLASPGVDRVFLVSGQNYPDALAVSAVAARDGSPVLLTYPDSLPAVTAAELDRLNPDQIVVIGGTSAVNVPVLAAAAQYGPTIRIAGASRYETAIRISQTYFPSGATTAFVTTGENFPDALTAGPAAGTFAGPILLTPPGGLPPEVLAELDRLGLDQVHIAGGPVSVSPNVANQLSALNPFVPIAVPEDREDFLFSTGAWATTETGLNDVDFWMGGLAERLDPFGGMLGSSFNFVFETQLEKLQFGDRFYYLFRNEGEQLFAALEGNTFSDMIQRNTDASKLPADIFALQDPIVDIEEQAALPAAQREPGLSLVGGQWRWQGDEHVEMHGTPSNDNIRGDEGDDSVWGYDGNDRIEGGAGNDALVGGKGDDIITDSFGDDNLKGKQGNDAINVGGGIDLAIGGIGDDFIVNGGGDGSTFFAGMGDDILLGTSGRMTVFGGEHDDWIEGSSHGDLLQGDNADQFQNDTLGGNDVVTGGPGGIDDVEGEGGNDILIGSGGGTKRYHGGLGWDWITYYGQPGSTSDWAFNRVFEPNNPLPDRFDLLEAMSGGEGNDTLRGPITNPDDLAASEIELNKPTEEDLGDITGLREMLRPSVDVSGTPVALGDFSLSFLRGAVESDSDGVHKIILGGPGSDVVEGRGGNDYLDGDNMLRVRLTDGVDFFDSAADVQARVFAGTLNPGAIDIVRDIVADPNADEAIDTAYYRNTFDSYTITPIGPLGSSYWRVEHTLVAEPEESDGTDVIRGFERLQFADGCAELSENGLEWESCEPTSAVTMDPANPVEAAPVTATVWNVDGNGDATDVEFDLSQVTNVRYAWWAGEGETADTVTEWEEVPNTLGTGSPVFTPSQAEVGMFLRVTVSFTAADGSFRTATSAVSATPVAEGPTGPGSLTMVHANPLIPGAAIPAGTPTDPDGGIAEDSTLEYQWSWTDADPNVEGATPTWTDYPADAVVAPGTAYTPTDGDIGRWIRVTISYTDGGGNADQASAWTQVPVTAP